MRRLNLVLALVVAMCVSSTVFAGDAFRDWRGGDGQGHSDAKGVPHKWGEETNIAWKTKIPGLGWSTPVVESGRLWVTTAIEHEATKEQIAEKKAKLKVGLPMKILDSITLRAVCLDVKTGKVLHDIKLFNHKDPSAIYLTNSYASPTALVEDGKVYCHFGTYGTACIAADSGKVLWTEQTLKCDHVNGPGSSPVLSGDLLILHYDGIDVQYIAALNKKTGKVAWKVDRSGELRGDVQLKKAYATSLVTELNGREQVISPAADWIYGYEPTTGKELWKMKYGQLGFSNAIRPLVKDGIIYTCTGFMKSKLMAFKVSKEFKTEVLWQFDKQVPNVGSPVIVGDEIYFASDRGIVTCVDIHTGKALWTERLGKRFWASPLYADGKVFFIDTAGVTTVVEPGREFKKIAVNKLDGIQYAGLSAIDGTVFVRTDKAVYCVRD